MGVVGVVFWDPPAEAHPDQRIPDRQSEQPVRPAGSKDLLVPRVVADEAQLGEHHTQESRGTECGPRIAHHHQRRPSGGKNGDGQHDLHAVIARSAVKKAGIANLYCQYSEVARRGVDGRCLHVLSSFDHLC